jgi:hypothetical protein
MVEQSMARTTSPSAPLRGPRRLTGSASNRSGAQAMRGVSHHSNTNRKNYQRRANTDRHSSHGFVVQLDRPNRSSSTMRTSQLLLSKKSTASTTPTAILPVPIVIKPLASLQPEQQPQALPSWMAMSGPPPADWRPPSSGSTGGLDLLMIALAKEQERQDEERRLQKHQHHHDETSAVSTSASSSEDDEDGVDDEETNSSRRMMPPPPPRRPRSNSSPASMTPTTTGLTPPVSSAIVGTGHRQQHVQLLLPDSFLQRELAELRQRRVQRGAGGLSTPPTIFEDAEWNETPPEVVVEPAERLRLIKSRLLQEVSTGPHYVTFPHELPQYQNVRLAFRFRSLPLT